MRKHNGMRPQDIVVLLKILSIKKEEWQFKDLASSLFLSAAEVSESLNRSQLAGLISEDKRRANRLNVLEFIQYGLHYVFPQSPGAIVNGIPTAHSHAYFQKQFGAELKYVWPYAGGKQRGAAILPLYAKQPAAAQQDEKLYFLLACVDVIRVGKAREVKVAIEALKKEFANELQAKHS